MKIFKRILILTTLFALFITTMVSAKEFLPKQNVAQNKTWVITFNMPIDVASTGGNISITLDKTGEQVGINQTISGDRKSITVVPQGNYLQGEAYTIKINTKLQSGSRFLKEESILKFTVEKDVKKEISVRNIQIGDSENTVISNLGQPVRKDLSQYGFKWYIYNADYSNYVQVGISDGKVVGLYTNAMNLVSKKGIKIGTPKSEVERVYGAPLEQNEEEAIYFIDDYYATIFYDIHNDNTVTGVQIIENNVENQLKNHYGQLNDEVRKGYEMQIFDLANSVRVRMGKIPYIWNDKIATVARNHSKDMADKAYFAHTNLEGKNPFQRMSDAGITYTQAGENIAAGQESAIFAHSAWMNSLGHRQNILGNCAKLGVGVYFGGSYRVYYTQNFFTGN